MKQLPLQNLHYSEVTELYAEWLHTLGHCSQSVKQLPVLLREFFYHQEQQGIYELQQLSPQHIERYYQYIKQRKNTRTGIGLSNASINNHRFMLVSFCNYLRQTGRMLLPAVSIRTLNGQKEKLNTLTEEEIKQLFKASYTIDAQQQEGRTPLGERDRAMLSIFYGCGLRRTEAINLTLEDINSGKQVLHVKKGKNYKERLVPINPMYLQYIEEYLHNSRNTLLGHKNSPWLFISQRGTKLGDQAINIRLHKLAAHTGNATLINKQASLHTLRHSIATHLLHRGVQLEHIAKFLGHSSLESTEIYTHLNI